MTQQSEAKYGLYLLIEHTETELERFRQIIFHAQEVERTLVQSLTTLKSLNPEALDIVSENGLEAIEKKLEHLKDSGYPYNGDYSDKAIFILKRENVSMRGYEIGEEMARMEGILDSKSYAHNLIYKLNQIAADGKLVIAKIKNRNSGQFYCLPEFFSSLEKGNIKIKDEHLPKNESWSRTTPVEERNFDNAKWIAFIQ